MSRKRYIGTASLLAISWMHISRMPDLPNVVVVYIKKILNVGAPFSPNK